MNEINQLEQAYFDRLAERLKNNNLHKSPFEAFQVYNPKLSFKDTAFKEEIGYEGTVGNVLDELERALQTSEEGDHYKTIAVGPHHLIRGVLDGQFDDPKKANLQAVLMARDIGLNTYRGDYTTALSLLQQFRNDEGSQFLSTAINKPGDFPTWMATEPRRSYETAIQLAFDNFPEQDMLFISLGQGATAAGMDVFLRFQDITQRSNSEFYPVRFSRNRKADPHPVLTGEEIKFLQEAGKGKKIIIFEEDTVTARTLQQGTDFFRTNVFPTQKVKPISNYYAGPQRAF